jgi:hypothetical protein
MSIRAKLGILIVVCVTLPLVASALCWIRTLHETVDDVGWDVLLSTPARRDATLSERSLRAAAARSANTAEAFNNAELQARVRSLLRAKFYRQQIVEKNALLERILTRWHSATVVKGVLEDASRLQLGGVRSGVTVLFADLSGLMHYAESVAPEQVMDTLNQTFSRLSDIV